MSGKIKQISQHTCITLDHRVSLDWVLMHQLKTVSDYHKTLKQNLGVRSLFSSREWTEDNINIGQCFVTFFSCCLSFRRLFQKTLKTESVDAFSSLQICHCLFPSYIMNWRGKKHWEVVKRQEMSFPAEYVHERIFIYASVDRKIFHCSCHDNIKHG